MDFNYSNHLDPTKQMSRESDAGVSDASEKRTLQNTGMDFILRISFIVRNLIYATSHNTFDEVLSWVQDWRWYLSFFANSNLLLLNEQNEEQL